MANPMRGITFDPEILAKLEAEAEKEHRGISQQIVYILEQWFQRKEKEENGTRDTRK